MNILEQLAKALEQRTPLAGSDFFGITRTEREVIISTLREFAKPPEVEEWKPIPDPLPFNFLRAGDRVRFEDGKTALVGDMNELCGLCNCCTDIRTIVSYARREPQSSEDK